MTIEDYAGDNAGFTVWLKNIDAKLTDRFGLGVLDLADQNYLDMYEDGYGFDDVVGEMEDNGDLW